MPRKPQGHRLFVHSRIWRPLGLSPGTTVRVHLELDPEAGEVDIPEWIVEAMDPRGGARATFATLGAATRREIVAWLVRARHEETRERRLETALDRLESGRLRSD